MFINLDTDDSAYETTRRCLPYYYAAAATSPHVQAMAAERPTGRVDHQPAQASTPTPQPAKPRDHAPRFLRRQRVGVGRARRQGT